MRTKILSVRELLDGAQGIVYISEAIEFRVQDLTRLSILSSIMPSMLT